MEARVCSIDVALADLMHLKNQLRPWSRKRTISPPRASPEKKNVSSSCIEHPPDMGIQYQFNSPIIRPIRPPWMSPLLQESGVRNPRSDFKGAQRPPLPKSKFRRGMDCGKIASFAVVWAALSCGTDSAVA